MSKRMIGMLFILSVMLALVGAGLIIASLVGSPLTTAHKTGFANLPLFLVGVVIAALSLVSHLIAWAGALINLARLQHWGWFVCVLIVHGSAVLLYLIAGPTAPASATPFAPVVGSSDKMQHTYRS
jgi:hypothetical protein